RFVWTWAYLPVAIFLLVAVLQLTPLPASIVRTVSPHTASLKTELLSDLPDSHNLLSSMTLTFYPRATRHDLRLALAVAVVFVVVANFYRSPARIKRLLAAVTVIGGGIALLALAQDLAGNGKIFWSVPTYTEAANSGPFINHSHYGQFMNLSIGAALALLLMRLHESFAGRAVTPARIADYFASSQARTTKLLLATIVLAVATVFVSLTRGGMISMLIAAAFATLMLSRRRSLQGRSWIMVLLALGAFDCVLYAGFDEVYDRLATLQEINQVEGGRWQIVKDIALAWTRFPIFGVGLGTHEVVYPMFDRSTIAALAMHAENEYAQAAEETGAVGLLALACFGVLVWRSYARSTAASSVPIRSAAYGLGFGLMAILIHSLSDFGQHLPANGMLSAVSCGLLIALTRLARTRNAESIPQRTRSLIPLRAAMLALVIGVSAWSIHGANGARVAESHWNKVLAAQPHIEAMQWRLTKEARDYLFTHAVAAMEAEPDNVQYRHWFNAYKWSSLVPDADPNTGVMDAEILPQVREIVEGLHAARPLCPTFGATYCLAGEIERFVLMDPDGAAHIRTGYRLAPCDSTACFAAARCDAEEGRQDEAFGKLLRAVQLNDRMFPQAVAICVTGLRRPDLAVTLAADNPRQLAYVSNALAASGTSVSTSCVEPDSRVTAGTDDVAAQAETKAFEQLKRQCERSDAPAAAHASLASYYRRRGDTDAAIQQYRRALMKDYDRVDWHYAMAQSLADAGDVEGALREAGICLRLRSDHAGAKRLIGQLAVRPRTTGQPLSRGN
ncbi:MAG: O-antigen ligase family protein, partial [Phycisphaerales bacterium]